MFLAKSLNAAELNGLPLSDVITLSILNAEITLSRTGIVAFAKVDLVTSTTGYLENSSVIMNRSSPDGRGPQKSTLVFSHGSFGMSDNLNGSMGPGTTVTL